MFEFILGTILLLAVFLTGMWYGTKCEQEKQKEIKERLTAEIFLKAREVKWWKKLFEEAIDKLTLPKSIIFKKKEIK